MLLFAQARSIYIYIATPPLATPVAVFCYRMKKKNPNVADYSMAAFALAIAFAAVFFPFI